MKTSNYSKHGKKFKLSLINKSIILNVDRKNIFNTWEANDEFKKSILIRNNEWEFISVYEESPRIDFWHKKIYWFSKYGNIAKVKLKYQLYSKKYALEDYNNLKDLFDKFFFKGKYKKPIVKVDHKLKGFLKIFTPRLWNPLSYLFLILMFLLGWLFVIFFVGIKSVRTFYEELFDFIKTQKWL